MAVAGKEGLPAGTPLLLLPVRLETRFMDVGDGGSELWVRLYPDQISVDGHQPELTADEIAAGQAYWAAVGRAGSPPDPEALRAPWRALAGAFTPQRAAWIALRTDPGRGGPPPTPRTTAEERAPAAACLPDRWTVVTYGPGGVRAHSGAPVRPGLAVGLRPGGGQLPPDLPVDEGMRWLVDFGEAQAAGMALRIPLSAPERQQGFDRVIAYGVRAAQEGEPASSAFTALLDAHHYTDGLAWVPQGSPTNNTADAASAFSRSDRDFETSFQVERQARLTSDPDADGPAAAALLGLPTSPFDHVRFSDRHDQEDARQAAIALWPATLGYFLRQLMADSLTAAEVDAVRRWFCDQVRPRGPLPAFRAGTTPYGVLPASTLRFWDGRVELPPVVAKLADLLRRALPTWLSSAAGTPRVGGSGDPDQDLVGILGMDASAASYRARWVMGGQLLWLLFPWLGLDAEPQQRWWDEHMAPGRSLLARFGHPELSPRVIQAAMAPDSFAITNPTVTAGPLSETDPLRADALMTDGTRLNYIQWLRQASPDDIRSERYPGPKPDSLLYHVLRQSLLLEYTGQAADAELRAGRLTAGDVAEPELPDVSDRAATMTAWDLLARPSVDRPGMTWAEYLHAFTFPPGSPYGGLEEVRASFDWLAGRPTAELDRLLTETLDACSHRLDCWVTAMATWVLRQQRAGGRERGGLHLGAFGWVEDVRPAPRPQPVLGPELEAVGRLDELRRQAGGLKAVPMPASQPAVDNGGFVFAPSSAQAAAGAVLRSGYLSHRQASGGRLLAIDLSSARTREALWTMDAVRQGQPLGAVLGYRFEQGLHRIDRDLYAQPFRDRFPLVADRLTPGPGEAVAATNVVDGVGLQQAWSAGTLTWGGDLPAAGSPDQGLVFGLLRDLDDICDALADLATSEAVYQTMLGNYGRAGDALDGMARGDRPPEPRIVETQRPGFDVTHRVLVLLAGGQAASPGWDAVTPGARALTEPRLDLWLGQQLPDPRTVRGHVEYQAGGATDRVPVTLAQLDIGPLDLLAMSQTADLAQAGELEQRILLAAVPAGASRGRIDFQLAAADDAGFVSFPDVLFAARTLRDLVGSARPLEPRDLVDLDRRPEDVGGSVDLPGLRTRASDALGRLDGAIADLSAAITAASEAGLRSALMEAAALGAAGAVPEPGEDAAALAARAQRTSSVLQKRRAAIGALPPAATVEEAVRAIQQVFGGSLPVLPLFTPPDAATLQEAFGDSAALIGADAEAPARWIQQLTHVRPAVSRLDMAQTARQLLVGGDAPGLTVAQLPRQAGDTWLAVGVPAQGITRGRVALATLVDGELAGQPYAGLMVDEWPERIPGRQLRAGLAFHYEEPKARAPQCLLLAVCPDGRPYWDDEVLRAILEDTLDLARVRTVDLDSVEQVGQLLPALYFAFNPRAETVSMVVGFHPQETQA